MLKIRFQRMGKKKNPTYRLIVSEHTKDTQAGTIEILGTYLPTQQPKVVTLKTDRINHWIAQGAKPSESVNNLLINEGIIKGDKQKSVVITNKRQAKLDKKRAEQEEAKRQAEEAKAAAEAEAKAAAEAEAAAAKEAEEAAKAAESAEAEAPAEETSEEAAPAEETSEEAPAESTEEEKEA
jgi:small subunit ribosomal protein S16